MKTGSISRKAKAHNELWRDRVTRELREIGYDVPDSAANFVLIPFGTEPGRTAQDADAHLNAKRIILRQVGAYKLPHALRMTIRLDHENRAVLDASASSPAVNCGARATD